MKVKMLQSMRGPNVALNPGDIHEGPDTELTRWCERGIATPIKRERKKATIVPVEKTVVE